MFKIVINNALSVIYYDVVALVLWYFRFIILTAWNRRLFLLNMGFSLKQSIMFMGHNIYYII